MTNDDRADAAEPGTRRRKIIASTIVVAIVLIGGGGALAVTLLNQQTNAAAPTNTPGAQGPSSTPSGSASPSTAPTEEPTDGPSGAPTSTPAPAPTVDPDFGQPVADRASSGKPASFGDEITATRVSSKQTEATGSGVGEVSGPAVAVTIKVTNRSSKSLNLATVVVNAYYGKKSTPASPVESAKGQEPFTGILRAGKSATATYVFSVPKGSSDDLLVTLSKGTDASVVVLEP